MEEGRPISSASLRRRLRKLLWLSVVSALLFCGLEAASASAAGSNLALNRPVSASSIEGNEYAAADAVDGSRSTRWSSSFSDPQWISVDLGSTYDINEVVLDWETAYGKAYKIQVSPDATNWTTIYSTTTGTGGTDELTGLSGTGRYVRMYGTARGTSWGYSLWELAVYGTPVSPPTTDLALNRPVSASSVFGHAAADAVDGSLSTRWSSNYSDPQWIYVDLGATYNINEVVLDWERAYGEAYQIQVSPDATNWTTIYSTTTGTGGTDELTGLSGTGRYVRMYGTARGTQWGYSLWELAVYGTPVSGTPPPPPPLPPPPPPPVSSIYWGALMEGNETYDYYYGPSGFWKDAPWGNKGNTWDRFESNAGKKVSILHYGQPNPWLQTAFYGSTANIVTGRGAIPEIDMSSNATPFAEITDGVYDSSIKAWANNVKAWGKPFFLRWDWEMNGTWFGWGSQAQADPAAFVAMWRHFHDVVVGQGASNVTWVWCPNLEFSGSTPLSQLYPGDAYVDWTCVDGYNSGATSQSFTGLYQQTYNHLLAVAPTKPIMIGEVGSLEYGSGVKASWITDMLTVLPSTFPRIKAVDWFNWRINKSGVYKSWPIESSASSQIAFAAGIASPYYAPNSFGNLPLLTKVKPLP